MQENKVHLRLSLFPHLFFSFTTKNNAKYIKDNNETLVKASKNYMMISYKAIWRKKKVKGMMKCRKWLCNVLMGKTALRFHCCKNINLEFQPSQNFSVLWFSQIAQLRAHGSKELYLRMYWVYRKGIQKYWAFLTISDYFWLSSGFGWDWSLPTVKLMNLLCFTNVMASEA